MAGKRTKSQHVENLFFPSVLENEKIHISSTLMWLHYSSSLITVMLKCLKARRLVDADFCFAPKVYDHEETSPPPLCVRQPLASTLVSVGSFSRSPSAERHTQPTSRPFPGCDVSLVTKWPGRLWLYSSRLWAAAALNPTQRSPESSAANVTSKSRRAAHELH